MIPPISTDQVSFIIHIIPGRNRIRFFPAKEINDQKVYKEDTFLMQSFLIKPVVKDVFIISVEVEGSILYDSGPITIEGEEIKVFELTYPVLVDCGAVCEVIIDHAIMNEQPVGFTMNGYLSKNYPRFCEFSNN